jgi:hypothetical protein
VGVVLRGRGGGGAAAAAAGQSKKSKKRKRKSQGAAAVAAVVVADLGRQFEGSNFKAAYDQFGDDVDPSERRLKPTRPRHIQSAVAELLDKYCILKGIDRQTGTAFADHLENTVFDNAELMQELCKDVAKIAQRLWTSADRCGGASGEELCAIVNLALWTDDPSMSADLAMFCRCINPTLARRDADAHFPPGGVVYRGAAVADSKLEFYRSSPTGTKFRIPAFVATTFQKKYAKGFLHRAWAWHQTRTPRPGVLFVVRVDPRGEDDEAFRCQNASPIRKRMPGVPDEHEYLFTQYSVFTLTKFVEKAGTNKDPHEVHLFAAEDNRGHGVLPLAPGVRSACTVQ